MVNRTSCQNRGYRGTGCGTPGTCATRPSQMQSGCGCTQDTPCMPERKEHQDRGCSRMTDHKEERPEWIREVPSGNRNQLLKYITEVSFGVYEALLFLDTHCEDREALRYFRQNNEKRNFAMKEYAKLYGPLTISTAEDDCDSKWKWVNQPWPWEGGEC